MDFKGIFELLVDGARGSKVFRRNKKPLRAKVTSAVIYQAGLSCHCVADLLSLDCKASYEAARQWFHRLKQNRRCHTDQEESILGKSDLQ